MAALWSVSLKRNLYFDVFDLVSIFLEGASRSVLGKLPSSEKSEVGIELGIEGGRHLYDYLSITDITGKPQEVGSPSFPRADDSFDDANLLYSLVRTYKPRIVIETGVSKGTSSRAILAGLNENRMGVLYSIEFPTARQFLKGEIGCLVPKELSLRWNVFLGKSSKYLPKLLARVGGFDLFIHDSDHSYANMSFEMTLASHYLNPNGLLIIDDIDLNDAYFDFCQHFHFAPTVVKNGTRNIGVLRKRAE